MSIMLKTTMHCAIPATFNMGLLFENVSISKYETVRMINFLKSKNIRDYRICADEYINKGHSFSDIGFDLAHYLFDSINFHQLVDSDKESDVLDFKIKIYNDTLVHFKMNLLEWYRDALVENRNEYTAKIRMFFKCAVDRSVQLHKTTHPHEASIEGVNVLWQVVDHYIFVNKMQRERDLLKTLKANQS